MQTKEKLELSKMVVSNGSLMFNRTLINPYQLPLFAIAESLAASSAMILIDKSPVSPVSTQRQESSPASAVGSTSSAKVYAPYWTDFCRVISSRLWLPTEIALQGLDLNSFNTLSSKTVDQSWFLMQLFTAQNQNSQPIFSQSFTSLLAESVDSESTVSKSKKIRIYPSPDQEKILSSWFGAGRFVYNKTIEYLNQPETKANWKAIKGEILASLPEWCEGVPYQIKSIAIKDACDAVKANKRKSQKSGDSFAMKFRSRKDPVQSCYVPKAAVKPQGVYYTMLGNLRYGEPLPTDFGDCRLIGKYGKFYLCVPFESPRRLGDNQARVVALDPGVRNFITFFSENSCGQLGINANLKIQKLCFKLDDLISRMSKANVKQKKSMKLAEWRLKDRIQNLVDELHKKTARFLCDNFDVILLPTFETSQMVRLSRGDKAKRKLTSKSARQMLTLSHFKFKQFIKHKAFETGKLVIDVCEAYTSKTVSWTGELKKIGGAKRIKGNDGQVMDRDINGARGIFLRAVVDTPSLKANLSQHFAADVSIC